MARGCMEVQKDGRAAEPPTGYWRRWVLVGINIIFVLAGQTAAILLGRFYFNEGGNSKWMSSLLPSAGFPIFILAYFLFSSPCARVNPPEAATSVSPPSTIILTSVYVSIGILTAGSNLLYAYGLLYLPVSTFSLICATQVGFNALISRFINSQKLTHLILNSVVLLTFSAVLLGIRADSDASVEFPKDKYALGFILSLGASATYALTLCLFQLSFRKVLKREDYFVVLEMQAAVAAVASCICVAGIFASGEWKMLGEEMRVYRKGKLSYVMTLVGTAVAWQVSGVGILGLIFEVSSLFSSVISTLALAVVPVFAVAIFGDKMDGEKVIAMLLGIWGFASYAYQQYLDDKRPPGGDDGEAGDPTASAPAP